MELHPLITKLNPIRSDVCWVVEETMLCLLSFGTVSANTTSGSHIDIYLDIPVSTISHQDVRIARYLV